MSCGDGHVESVNLMPSTMALILAGGHSDGFGVLTRNRTKASLPFAGFYRLIDFALTNLSLSGIQHVGLIIQYLPASLIEHVGEGHWWDFRGLSRTLKIMPPFVGQGVTEWYSGTADAIYQNLNFVEDRMPDDVMILSGEHVYKMDYRPLLDFHRSREADVTVVCKTLPRASCSRRFGYLALNEKAEVVEYCEKPDAPPSQTISLGVNIFRREVLIEWLEANARQSQGHNLARDVIPYMVGATKMYGYSFEGHWDYLLDIEAYFHAHQRLLRPRATVQMKDWEIMTNLSDRGLCARVSAWVSPSAEIERSLLSPGVVVEGTVRGSVLSPGVVVERGAVVEDCVLMHDAVVRAGARLRRVVCDKDVVFEEQCRVGTTGRGMDNGETDSPPPLGPITIVGKGARIESGARVPAGEEIAAKPRRLGRMRVSALAEDGVAS